MLQHSPVDARRRGRHTIDTDAKVKNLDWTCPERSGHHRRHPSVPSGRLRRPQNGRCGTLPSPDPQWREHWPALTDLGAAALCVPEERGGLGMQVEVAAATAAVLGAALHGSPYA